MGAVCSNRFDTQRFALANKASSPASIGRRFGPTYEYYIASA